MDRPAKFLPRDIGRNDSASEKDSLRDGTLGWSSIFPNSTGARDQSRDFDPEFGYSACNGIHILSGEKHARLDASGLISSSASSCWKACALMRLNSDTPLFCCELRAHAES
jgi:hypothetical protein